MKIIHFDPRQLDVDPQARTTEEKRRSLTVEALVDIAGVRYRAAFRPRHNGHGLEQPQEEDFITLLSEDDVPDDGYMPGHA